MPAKGFLTEGLEENLQKAVRESEDRHLRERELMLYVQHVYRSKPLYTSPPPLGTEFHFVREFGLTTVRSLILSDPKDLRVDNIS